MTDPPPRLSKRQQAEKARTQRSRYSTITARWSAMGIQLVISTLLGYAAGHWLDKKFDTEPWCMLVGIALGLAAAIYDMIKLLKTSLRVMQEEDRSNKP